MPYRPIDSPLDLAVTVVMRQHPGLSWIAARQITIAIVADTSPGIRPPDDAAVIAAFNEAFDQLRIVD